MSVTCRKIRHALVETVCCRLAVNAMESEVTLGECIGHSPTLKDTLSVGDYTLVQVWPTQPDSAWHHSFLNMFSTEAGQSPASSRHYQRVWEGAAQERLGR